MNYGLAYGLPPPPAIRGRALNKLLAKADIITPFVPLRCS